MNPFKYGQVVSGSDFCPRPELEKTLRSHIESNQNVHVTGERRTGKTSLILETISRLKTPLVHVDLFQAKSTHDIYTRMLDGIVVSVLQPTRSMVHSVGRVFCVWCGTGGSNPGPID